MQFIKLSDIKELPEFPLITKDSQLDVQNFPYQAYAYDFMEWKDSLGAELLFKPDDHEYECMAEFMEELLFFGYDEETHDDKVEEETTELKRRMDEAEDDLEAHCISAYMDEMMRVYLQTSVKDIDTLGDRLGLFAILKAADRRVGRELLRKCSCYSHWILTGVL